MKTKKPRFKEGQRIRYNDGRDGHNVLGTVLTCSEYGMNVKWDDRARYTPIFFNEPKWMDFITAE